METSLIPTFSMAADDIVLFGFLITTGFFVIFTAIFYYHWQTYATDNRVKRLTFLVYLVSTLPLLLIMGLMTLVV